MFLTIPSALISIQKVQDRLHLNNLTVKYHSVKPNKCDGNKRKNTEDLKIDRVMLQCQCIIPKTGISLRSASLQFVEKNRSKVSLSLHQIFTNENSIRTFSSEEFRKCNFKIPFAFESAGCPIDFACGIKQDGLHSRDISVTEWLCIIKPLGHLFT